MTAKKSIPKKRGAKPGTNTGVRAGSVNAQLAVMAVGDVKYVPIDKNNRANAQRLWNPAQQHRPAELVKMRFSTNLYTAVPASSVDDGIVYLLEVTRKK